MTTYETATTPGTAANKASKDDNENTPVDKEERAPYRIIGKLERMTHTHTHKRPDLSFATQELATTNIHRVEKSEAHTEVPARYVSSPHIGKAIPGSKKAVNNEAWKSNNSRRVVEEEEHKKHYTIRNFLTETIPHEQTTNTHPHGLHQCQNHCNRNRANAPKYHTTTDTHWHTTSAQKSACQTTLQTY